MTTTNNPHDLDGDGKLSEEEKELIKMRWETKRKIIWLCILGIFLFGFLFIGLGFTDIAEAKFKIISEVITTIIFGYMAIIGSYFGFSVWQNKGK